MKPLLPALVLLGAALTGCAGGSADSQHPRSAADSPRASEAGGEHARSGDPDAAEPAEMPTGCHPRSTVSLPPEFPKDLPVPQGATVTGVEHRSGHRLVVGAVTHHGFKPALTFLQKELPKAGYQLREGEVEEHDAESNFVSSKVKGRWTLRVMPDCENGVYLTYLTGPMSGG